MRTSRPSQADRSLLVAIPVYNEESYVNGVLSQVRHYARNILVVDDGSTDRTPDLLARHGDVSLIRHPENRGYGQSIAAAFRFAQTRGFEWLITMDCDEQHEPCCIPRFMEVARDSDADVISGTRYPNGHDVTEDVPQDRRAINAKITALLNHQLGLAITDAFCGFKAYRVSSLDRINLTVPGYAMPMQWWVQVARAGLKVRELPVRLIYVDPNRHFGGMLDDPDVRLAHYLEVFQQELNAQPSDNLSESACPCHP